MKIQQILLLFYLAIIFSLNVDSQILYECNFDNSTLANHCFIATASILIQKTSGSIHSQPPESPFSDVTSILKPASDGQICSLPYKVGIYLWEMYFCHNGRCPTPGSLNGSCVLGNFGLVRLTGSGIRSYQLKTSSNGINGSNEQCLIYYYYMSIGGQKSITIRKVEIDEENKVLDIITNSSFNGWNRREVTFFARTSGYKLYFDAQKISTDSYAPYVGFDEITVYQGSCAKEITTIVPLDTTSISSSTVQTTQIPSTSTTQTTPVSSTSTTQTAPISSTSTTQTTPISSTSAMQTIPILSTSTTQTSSISSTSATQTTQMTTTTMQVISTRTTISTVSFVTTTRTTSEPSKTTTSHNILLSTTISSLANFTVIDSESVITPPNNIYTIVLACTTALVSIVIIGILIRMRMSSSTSILKSISRTFKNANRHNTLSSDLELDLIEDDSAF